MIDDQRLLDRYLRIGLEGDSQVPRPPNHPFQTVREGSSWEGGRPIQLPLIPQDSTITNNYRQYQDSEGIETDSVRNPPRPVKRSRLGSFTSDSLFDKDSELSEGSEHTELTLPLLDADCCNERIVTDTFYSNNQCNEEYTMASGTRGSSIPRFSTTGRVTSLQHVLKNVLECDLTSPLYLSVLQHFGGDEDKFNVIDYFLCNQTYFKNLSYSETVIENPNKKDPAKVVTRVERYHVPNYLKARCIFFKKFLEDKKNDGEDLNYESFYMGLTLDNFMAWKAEEMTMNMSSPCVAKSRDLVADFKKGIK
jgi:hypothetical protein